MPVQVKCMKGMFVFYAMQVLANTIQCAEALFQHSNDREGAFIHDFLQLNGYNHHACCYSSGCHCYSNA